MKPLLYIFIVCLTVLSCQKERPETTKDYWALVEGGTFEQGKNQFIISPKGDTIHGMSSPNRMVTLNDFYIAKYEVTVAQFKDFCKSTNRPMPEPPKKDAYGNDSNYQWQDDHPMLATWSEAKAYAIWAGVRLPTEAEWEYAAKGGKLSKGYIYSGSNTAKEVGWVQENSDSTFHKIGLLKPNELGIHDMTGNVSEWVFDWYNPKLDSLVSLINPLGPRSGDGKITKGISWFYASENENGIPLKYGIHIPETRYQSPINTRNDGIGFRLAKSK